MAWVGYVSHWTIDLDSYTDCKLGYFVFMFGAHYSSVLLAVMSIEKFFALYFPLRAKSYCTVGTAKWVTAILALVIAGFNVPLLIFYNFDGKMCVTTKHSSLLEIMDTMLYSLVPIVIMLIANSLIMYKLMYIKCKGISHRNQSVSKFSTRGSVMVLTVSLAFILLTTPRAVDSAIKLYISADPFGRLGIITMQYLNHSINGILYCLLGGKFREELLTVISFCRNNRMHNGTTSNDSVTTDINADS